jgi:lipopolysaccharide assembly outer membrane protein LptD (OstA)
LILALCIGCQRASSTKEVHADNVKKEKSPREAMGVQTMAGSSSRMDTSTKKLLWKLSWVSSDFEMTEGGQDGKMESVSGEGFKQGVPASRFVADSAVVERGKNAIMLIGNVRIESISESAVLLADRVVFDPDEQKYYAEGNVRLDHPSFAMDSGDKLVTSSDLKRFSTKDWTTK